MLKYNNMHDVVVDGLAEADTEELVDELLEREGDLAYQSCIILLALVAIELQEVYYEK